MKLISKKILFKRKTLLIFFIALVLPLIIVAYLGFDMLSERHRSTKSILESNLWITGESALNQLEDELQDIEAKILQIEHFQQVYAESILAGKSVSEDADSNRNFYSIFLLAGDHSIAYPRTGPAVNDNLLPDANINSAYVAAFRQAESYEFQESNYAKAAEEYSRCYELAGSEQDQAFALEGLGRTGLSQMNYSAAGRYYDLLRTKYSLVLNNAGHPYGIIGLLQLYETKKHQAKDENLIPEFFDTYGKLKNGFWKLSASAYGFFSSEIETVLESDLLTGANARYRQSYDSLKSEPSVYLDELEFAEYLRTDIINRINEVQILNVTEDDPQIRRIIGTDNGTWSLISYRRFMNFMDGDNYIGGIRWNTDTLRESVIPAILERISMDIGLDLFLSEEITSASHSGQIPENSLSLSFRSFPFPWKLIVVQPAIFNIEKESRNEMLIYGLLLGIVFIMMSLGAILIARDIKREADSMNMKTEFVHNVSHELKTPLSLIRLYGETLLFKESLSAAQKTDAFQVITKESERLSHMINNILDFSKIEMGRKEFNFQKGDFAKTILETLDSYRYHLEKEGFTIIEEIAKDIPLMVFDKEAIEGLMINLLSNAIKYSLDNKVLTIKLFKENEDVLLQVSDKGVGIASGDLSHIFDRFYRTKQKAGFESRGSGLGLTLVKHIVESHGGTIHVTSEPGKGSTFTLRFPFSKSSYHIPE